MLGILLILLGIFLLLGDALAIIPGIGPVFIVITGILRYKGPASIGLIVIGFVLNNFGI